MQGTDLFEAFSPHSKTASSSTSKPVLTEAASHKEALEMKLKKMWKVNAAKTVGIEVS